MLRKLHLTISLLLIGYAASMAQTGALKITVKDSKTGEAVPFASVVVESGGSQAGAGQTDFDGNVMIKPLPLGKVNVKVSYVGFRPMQISNVLVNDNKTDYVTIQMESSVQEIKEFTKVEYVVPLVDPNTTIQKTVTREQYKNMATRNVNSVAAQTAGVYQQDEGRSISVRGGRSSADKNNNDTRGGANGTPTESSTKTFIDGQRVIGSSNLPSNEIEQISVLISGLPAQYGDATSGVINITTRGPQSDYHGGIEVSSSQLTDAYGYNNAEFNFSGPLLLNTDTTSGTKNSILGFSLGGQINTEKDASPSAVGSWKVKDDVLKDLQEHPLRESPTSASGTIQNADYITYNDLQRIKARQNVRQNIGVINGKLIFKPTKNFNFILGGTYDYRKSHDYSYAGSLFNSDKNAITTTTTWRVYGRITQKFGNSDKESKDEKSAAIIKNAYYTLQGGYTQYGRITEDEDHGDNFFNYGHVGKFVTRIDTTRDADFKESGLSYLVTQFDGSNSSNPNSANYTEQYQELKGLGSENPKTLSTIQSGGGRLNGTTTPDVYSLWRSPGYQTAGRYSKTDNRQFQIKADFSADIKNHSIQLGFEYEQRNESFWQFLPTDIWSLMYNSANQHISQLDLNDDQFYNHIDGYDTLGNPITTTYTNHPRLYVEQQQTNFDRKLRDKLGYSRNSLDWIDINSYSPDTYSIDLFSADELLNDGNAKISYYGF